MSEKETNWSVLSFLTTDHSSQHSSQPSLEHAPSLDLASTSARHQHKNYNQDHHNQASETTITTIGTTADNPEYMMSSNTLSSRISSFSRTLVGTAVHHHHHPTASAASTTAAWIQPTIETKSPAPRLTAASLASRSFASSSSSNSDPTDATITTTATTTTTTTRSSSSATASSTNAALASGRGLQAVRLLPSYLADARQVQQYDPETAPHGALQLGVAESQLLTDLLLPALNYNNHQDGKAFTLTPDCIYYQPTHGRPGTRKALASYMTTLLNLPSNDDASSTNTAPVSLDVEGLVVGAGCNAVLENMCLCLAEAGDAVLIPTPYYAAFEFDLVARAQLHVQPVKTQSSNYLVDATDSESSSTTSTATAAEEDDNTPSLLLDPSVYYPTAAALDAAYEEAAQAGHPPKILLLSHPHNPLGICYPKHVLQECIEWCLANQVHLVSDEIYAGSVYNTNSKSSQQQQAPFHSILNVAAGMDTSTITEDGAGLGIGPYIHWVYAMSKDFALSGLRVGVAYSENPAIRLPMQKLNDLCQISSQTQVWVETLMQEQVPSNTDSDSKTTTWPEYFRHENHNRLRHRCNSLLSCLEECGIPYLPPTSGLFCWVDLSAYLPPVTTELSSDAERERALYLELVQEFGLLFTPGDSMQNEEPGFFRIVFTAASEDEFALGLERLRKFAAAKRAQQAQELR